MYPHVFDTQELANEQANRTAALRPSTLANVHAQFATVPLFAGCSKKELRLLAKSAAVEPRAPGAALVTEGEPGTHAFVVLQGTCRVVRKGRRVGAISVGGVVGELSLLTQAPRNATVIAETPLEVAVLGRREFLGLLESSPSITRKLLYSLAERVQQLDRNATC